jgi:hypothetical protein
LRLSKITRISKQNTNHTKSSSSYQNIKNKQNAPHALASKAFPKPRQVLRTTMPPCMKTGGPTRCCIPATEPKKPPRRKPTTPHIAIASHTIAAYVSPMVVSSITETTILSYLYQGSITSMRFQTMLRRLTCHNLYTSRSFRQHACILIISNAATCHNFFMLRSFRQHACSCKVCSHRPENAARRYARERRTDKTRHEGPEGALLFLRATSQVQK